MLISIIAGARPNFMKIAPIIDAIQNAKGKGHDISYRLIHTGQHYDKKMSGDFFEQLGIPEPDANLEAGGAHRPNKLQQLWYALRKSCSKTDLNLFW